MWVIIIASAIPALWPLLKSTFHTVKRSTAPWQERYIGSSKGYAAREKYVPFGEPVKGKNPDSGVITVGSQRTPDTEEIALKDLGAAPAENHIYRSRSITIETDERMREDFVNSRKNPWEWNG